jgi:hypothetical protein
MGNHFQPSQLVNIIVPLFLVLVLLCIVPVIAADIDITIEGPGISNWAFIPATTNIDSSNTTLNVSSVSSTWTVSVKDNLDFSKPLSTVGKMVEWDGSAYVTPGPWVLGMPVTIVGPTIPLRTTGTSVVLSGSDQIIESGLTPVTGLTMPLTISQPITYSDPVLRGGHVYQVIVTYVAFAEGGPAPIITGIVPAEGIIGSTVTVTDLSGSNFLPHSTAVLNRTGYPDINLTVSSVTPTRMTGTFNIPADTAVGKWDVSVTNPDGRTGTNPQLFWIKYPAAPRIGSWTPFGARGATNMYFGVTGDGFQNGMVVNLTYGTSVIQVTGLQVTPIFVNGLITIPSNAPTGDWDLTVKNNDGQSETFPQAFTVT